MGPKVRDCDECDGTGINTDTPDMSMDDCHLCEGAGGFDEDGFPADVADEVVRQILETSDEDALAGRWPPLVQSATQDNG